MEKLVCTIHSVRFYNPENGFSVLKVIPEGSTFPETMQIKMMEPTPGVTISAVGEWVKNKYGTSFSATEWEEEMPRSLIGIEGYLSSGLIKGIGPIYAKKIVQTFGTDTFNVLDNEPERLSEVYGIGRKRAAEIIESWTKQQSVRNLMIFLKHYNISTKLIIKIHRLYGENSIDIIKENPYRLADNIEGIGFQTADNIGLNLGIEMDDSRRVCCGMMYVMKEMSERGDVYSLPEDIRLAAGTLLEVDGEVIDENVGVMVSDGRLIDCGGRIYLKYLYEAEAGVAEKMKAMAVSQPLKTIPQLSIADIEAITGFKYESEQAEAIRIAAKSGIMVLTGGPGTGKTTVIRGIIEMLASMGLRIACAAPTGKAAKRMSELTGREAKTIHRLLEYNPELGFTYNAYNQMNADVLILDETSMVNITLMYSLMMALRTTTKLIMVGDTDQLPCIGPGNILSSCIESGVIPSVTLTKIFRQAQTSNIILNAHNVRTGNQLVINNGPESDFFFITRYEDITHDVVDLVTRRLPKKYGYKPTDIQVLTPMKKCEVGVDNLNIELQKAINPHGVEVKYGKTTYRVGDKVIQTANDYDKGVFNGDSGFIDSINTDEKIVFVRFDDNIVQYKYSDLEDLSLAYAMTIHKSQGSEYPIVVIPITYANKKMMQRNLIYTAITRAKQVCVMIGERRMVDIGIANATSYKRKTLLKERLRSEI